MVVVVFWDEKSSVLSLLASTASFLPQKETRKPSFMIRLLPIVALLPVLIAYFRCNDVSRRKAQ